MAESDDDIIELIDKIMGYADNQPLILNHLSVLREKVSALIAAHCDSEIGKETREAQIGHLHSQIEHLRHDLQDARAEIEQLKQKPQLTAESVEISPSRRLRGLENL